MKDIEIYGGIDVSENPVTIEELNDKFIEWIESNKWYFTGGVKESEE